MNFKDNMPIYFQIIENIKKEIFSGIYKQGEKLPPIRELAASLNVNPNTIVKVYSELERCELIITERTSGKYVTMQTEIIAMQKKEFVKLRTEDFLKEMKQSGVTTAEVVNLVQKWWC